jgi:glycosyltransferase involved in cell wall biosynthesis
LSEIKPSNKKKPVTKKEITHGFSIVIANFNYETYVTQAIESALNQHYSHDHFEVIIVDDGSTDNSRQLIADIAAKNNNLRVITQTNLGQAAAFYAGVNIAKHEWICLLDSDDYFKPEKLSVLNSFINKQQADCDFICHNVDVVNEVNNASQDWFSRQYISADHLSVDDAKGGYPYANPCGQVYRKRLLQKLAPWLNLSEWQRGADNALAWGSIFLNGRVCYLHQSLAVYRIHANNFFMASTPLGLVPKVNWLERWPKLIAFLDYLHQGAASGYLSNEDRGALLVRLAQFLKFWEKQLKLNPNVPYVSFITTCKNRLHHLKQTLPWMVKQSNAEVIVVDYGCTQGTRDWVKANYPQVKVVAVDDDAGWNAPRARNLGAAQAKADWLCFIDADILLKGDLAAWGLRNLTGGNYYLASPMPDYSAKGTAICETVAFRKSGGYDEACREWFSEDTIFYENLINHGIKEKGFPSNFIKTIQHEDSERRIGGKNQFSSRSQAMRGSQLYRLVNKDFFKITGENLDLNSRSRLITGLQKVLMKFEATYKSTDGRIIIDTNLGMTSHDAVNLDRKLIYSFRNKNFVFKKQVEKYQSYIPSAKNKLSEIPKDAFLMIIGAMKCGTTSLFEYLKSHPAICPSIVKEPEFFSTKQLHKLPVENYEELWSFDKAKHSYAMEASTGYTKFPFEKEVAKRIYDYGIRPKLLYIVRNPFDRIISHCRFMREKGDSKLQFTDQQVILTSNYFVQLEQFDQYFPNSILVLDFDDLKKSPKLLLDRVNDFLGIEKGFYPKDFLVVNKTENLKQKNLIPDNNFSENFLSDYERKFIYESLANDMSNFAKKYHFDVKKWGF